MKNWLISLTLAIVTFFSVSSSQVAAKVVTSQTGFTVASDEVIDDDLFVGGQTVDIAGTVNGDVFIGAQTVKITGTISGNLHVGTSVLDLEGNVEGNVYAGGQSIIISGAKIGGSLVAGAANLIVDKDSIIGGSIIAGAGTMSLDTMVSRSVYAGAGSLTVGANTKIGKDLYYAAGDDETQIDISKDASVSGSIYRSEYKAAERDIQAVREKAPKVLGALKIFSNISSFLGAVIVGFVYLKLFGEKNFKAMAELVNKSFWKSLGIGFLVTIVVLPGMILLAMTLVGIPMVALAALMLLIYMYMAKIVVGAGVGNWLANKFNWKLSSFWAFVLGLIAISLLKMVWIIGFFITLIVLWVGLGAFALKMLAKEK